MRRSYKKVPTIKEKEIFEICKNQYLQEVIDALFHSITFKNTIKEEYEEYNKRKLSKLVSSNRDS